MSLIFSYTSEKANADSSLLLCLSNNKRQLMFGPNLSGPIILIGHETPRKVIRTVRFYC